MALKRRAARSSPSISAHPQRLGHDRGEAAIAQSNLAEKTGALKWRSISIIAEWRRSPRQARKSWGGRGSAETRQLC